MIRIIRTMVMLITMLAFASTCFGEKKKPELVNDTPRRAQIKSVAVLTVYGPEKMTVGFSHFQEQALYDAMETELVRGLEKSGLVVLPPEQTKALLAKEFFEAYKPNMSGDMKKYVDQMRPAIEAGYLVHTQQSPLPSKNTRVLFGTDLKYVEIGTKKNNYQVGTDEKDYPRPPEAKYDEPLMKTLLALAPKFGTDGFVMLRVIPDIPTTVAKEASKWNPFAKISTGMSAIKAMKEGDHAFVTLDLSLYNNTGELAFREQVMRMSREGTGTGAGFNFTLGNEPADKLVASAAELALQKLFEDFSGRGGRDEKAYKTQ